MALETPSWLNVDLTEKILRRSEADNSIQVIDIFTKPATNKGDNYTSDMYRVNVEFSRNQGDKTVTEKKSILFKLAPMAEGVRKDVIKKSEIFDVEISMLSSTLKKMNELLPPENRVSGRLLHVQKDEPTFLVIEDLAPLGFRMADREAGLDLPHSILAIQGLARFHATSVAVYEKDPQVKKIYGKGIFHKDAPAEMRGFFANGTKALAEEIQNWPEFGKRYADKVRAVVDTLFDTGSEAMKCNEDEFNVITHGDFWVNNMLFRYDNKGKPVSHIMVDFQICRYTSPAIDLLYFMSTSISEDVYDNSKDVLLEEYIRTLSNTMKQIGCKTQPPSLADVKRSMKERAIYGMLASFTILPVVVVDKDSAMDLDQIMKVDGSYTNPAYKGATYRRMMSKRLPLYEKMGFL